MINYFFKYFFTILKSVLSLICPKLLFLIFGYRNILSEYLTLLLSLIYFFRESLAFLPIITYLSFAPLPVTLIIFFSVRQVVILLQ